MYMYVCMYVYIYIYIYIVARTPGVVRTKVTDIIYYNLLCYTITYYTMLQYDISESILIYHYNVI